MSNLVSPQVSVRECARKLQAVFCALKSRHFSLNYKGQIFLNGNLSGRFGSWRNEGRVYIAMWLSDKAIVKLHEVVSESPISIQDIEDMGIAILFEPPREKE